MIGLLPLGALDVNAQAALDSIEIQQLHRTNNLVSFRWNGGFPPYRVRVKSDLSSDWAELPEYVNTNTITFTSASSSAFFSVRTQYEPVTITQIYGDPDFITIRWTGGLPPYRVQMRDPNETNWIDLPELVVNNYYLSPAHGRMMLYRVRTEQDTNAPAPPVRVRIPAIQCDRLIIDWEPVIDGPDGSGVAAYNLYRDGELVQQIKPPKCYAFEKNLLPETTYSYAVAALDLAGNESEKSPPLPIVMPKCPAGGTNEAGASPALTLEWDRNEEPDVVGYVVHWGLEPGDQTWEIDVMQSTSVTIGDLESGVPYFFTVTAYTVDGVNSDPSESLVHFGP